MMIASMGEAKYEAWKQRHGISEIGDGVAASPVQAMTLDTMPARTDGLNVNMEVLGQIAAMDPESASNLLEFVSKADKFSLEQAVKRGEAMAVAAMALRKLPAGQRQAEFQRNWAPYLTERGMAPDILQQADLSDTGLERYYYQGRAIEKIIDSAESDRDYRLRQQNQEADNARADASLDLSRQREGRIAAKPASAGSGEYEYRIGPNGKLQRRKK